MSNPDQSPEVEKQNASFSLVDLNDLKRETVVQNMAGRLKGTMLALVFSGTIVGLPSVAIYKGCQEQSEMVEREAVQAQKFDERHEKELESFGSQGTVAQVHGERFGNFFQCVLVNDSGKKIIAFFDNDLPVVEGEIWEVEYDTFRKLKVMTQKLKQMM